jgi:hypothetical protein
MRSISANTSLLTAPRRLDLAIALGPGRLVEPQANVVVDRLRDDVRRPRVRPRSVPRSI